MAQARSTFVLLFVEGVPRINSVENVLFIAARWQGTLVWLGVLIGGL